MSVIKAMRGESAMQFIETARRLELHAFSVCTKAPKRYAPLLTNRIFELASTVHEEVRAANNIFPHNQHEAQMRRDHLINANRQGRSEDEQRLHKNRSAQTPGFPKEARPGRNDLS